jgi:hypothetical protein
MTNPMIATAEQRKRQGCEEGVNLKRELKSFMLDAGVGLKKFVHLGKPKQVKTEPIIEPLLFFF